MAPIELNLPEELQQFVSSRVQAGHFDSAASYIESLIKRAKHSNDDLDALLLAGLDSGEPISLDEAQWARIREDVQQRLEG